MKPTPADTNATMIAAAAIVAVVAVGGMAGAEAARIDDGTATVEVSSPTTDRLAVEPGRFGTEADYLRVPDLVVDVRSRSGTPRIFYRVSVPGMDLDRHATSLLGRTGRLRVHLPDVAYPPTAPRPDPGTYVGRIEVRVQSFGTDTLVETRSVRVRVPAS
jgi:hypothetical protein